jgi:hypothetical protein
MTWQPSSTFHAEPRREESKNARFSSVLARKWLAAQRKCAAHDA